jgi:4-hydroxythreonine-4-phosphate dehydrogenase
MPGERPTLALTVGDVAGVGPELLAVTLNQVETYSMCRPIVIGPRDLMAARSRAMDLTLDFREVQHLSESRFEYGTVDVLEPAGIERAGKLRVGEVSPEAGKIAALCLETAFKLASLDMIQGVVGAPLNKQAFRQAGYDYLDEIAFLAELTSSEEPRLFGILDRLWTTCVTLHVAFKEVASLITRERVLVAIRAMHEALEKSLVEPPFIAVAALNPHNGEGGLMGREEIDEIAPAVKEACEMGIRAQGPFPADTLFPRALAAGARGVVCMHHDQANIARKLHGFRDSASAFLGLPVPYATTAHGTAYDLVGHGAADPSSFLAALNFVVNQCRASKGQVPAQAPNKEGPA